MDTFFLNKKKLRRKRKSSLHDDSWTFKCVCIICMDVLIHTHIIQSTSSYRQTCLYKPGRHHGYTPLKKFGQRELTAVGFNFSSSFSRLRRSCRWRAWFSSDILILLARISDCTWERVCMDFKEEATCRLTDCPCTNDFSLINAFRALNALLACIDDWKNHSYISFLMMQIEIITNASYIQQKKSF